MERTLPLFLPSCLSLMIHCICLQQAFAQEPLLTLSTEHNILPQQETKNSIKEAYTFDPHLFQGSGLSPAMIERFNQADRIEAGLYKVDLYINDRFLERRSIQFIENQAAAQGVDACLSIELLEQAGILGDEAYRKQQASIPEPPPCLTITQVATGSSSHFDFSLLRLNMRVPQRFMKNLPRGYVNPADLDSGSSIGFVNYMGNYYYSQSRLSHQNNNESAFMSFNGGINLGKWQYRQQSNLSMNNEHDMTWRNLRSYVQRPVDQLQSQLILGQQYTSGRFLSGLAFQGLSLQTDQRMRPDSMRGYAPVIRGIAQSNAKVSIEQNGREIYQITVAPGPFEINDLYPTNYDGNLTVIVTEADGSKHSTEVLYAAVPTSLRAGLSNYSLALGWTDLDQTDDAFFSDINYEYGVSNSITVNGGIRFADAYQALAVGGVYGSFLGALGANLTYSRAELPSMDGQESTDGWMSNLMYSKTLQPTKTTITLAGYRYSTSGYREFSDILRSRYAWEQGSLWSSYNNLQRSRFQINLSQPLGSYGSFYLSGSTQDYRDGRERDTSLQAGYQKSFGILSVNLNYTRQKLHSLQGGSVTQERFDNFGGLSLSFPLGSNRGRLRPNLNANYNRSNDNDNYQVGISGALDEDYSLSYNLGMNGGGQSNDQTYNAGLYKRLSKMSLGLNSAYNQQYWQSSLNASGALAIHSGGITLGSYLGDTFALVEAKGAKGAKIISSPTNRIDRFGYALVLSISPYRYNTIALDPQGVSGNIELEGGEQRIAPYAGAAVKVNFKTRYGYSVLIQSRLTEGQNIPMGADVRNEAGEVIGMVGQAGQAYVRVEQPQGTLTFDWGNEAGQRCTLPYRLDSQQLQQPLIKLQIQCVVENQ